eukprot:2970306-Pyramimonas_sp.AAC.1
MMGISVPVVFDDAGRAGDADAEAGNDWIVRGGGGDVEDALCLAVAALLALPRRVAVQGATQGDIYTSGASAGVRCPFSSSRGNAPELGVSLGPLVGAVWFAGSISECAEANGCSSELRELPPPWALS